MKEDLREHWGAAGERSEAESRLREQHIRESKSPVAGVGKRSDGILCGQTFEHFAASWATLEKLDLGVSGVSQLVEDGLLSDSADVVIGTIGKLHELLEEYCVVSLTSEGRKRFLPVYDLLERTLAVLLGHSLPEAREAAVRMMNQLYDATSWQDSVALECTMTCAGEPFVVDCPLESPKETANYTLYISAFQYREDVPETVVTAHELVLEQGHLKPHYELCEFPKPGLYDWRVEEFCDGKSSVIRQGRYVVFRQGLKQELWEEVVVDLEGVQWSETMGNGEITKRGTLRDVQEDLESYQSEGVKTLYLMGVLERDNDPMNHEGRVVYRKPGASQVAIVDRNKVSQMMGGDRQFLETINLAHDLDMNVTIQFDLNISSSRFHRKYNSLVCHTMTEDGFVHPHRGTDGRENEWDDQLMLNYRKIESWHLFRDEILSLVDRFAIDGVHVREAQSAPLLMEIHVPELKRRDPDDVAHYSQKDLFEGSIVYPNLECGYWNTTAAQKLGYPNPFFVGLWKAVLLRHPNFLITGDCHWYRGPSLAISGVLPVSDSLACEQAKVYGRRISKDGSVSDQEPPPVNSLLNWLERQIKLPKGLIDLKIRCHSNECLPYPALLFGRGAWTAVDLLYTLPGIPMLFIDEDKGKSYRVDLTNVYSENKLSAPKPKELQDVVSQPTTIPVTLYYTPRSGDPVIDVAIAGSFNDWSTESHKLKPKKSGCWRIVLNLLPGKYYYKIVENGTIYLPDPNQEESEPDGLGGVNSVLFVEPPIVTNPPDLKIPSVPNSPNTALAAAIPAAPATAAAAAAPSMKFPPTEAQPVATVRGRFETATQRADLWYKGVDLPQISFIPPQPDASPVRSWTRQNSMNRIRSYQTMDTLKGMSDLEKKHRSDLGPEFGFDLLKIKHHYIHRRNIRLTHPVFSEGRTIPLSPKQGVDGRYILCFARVLDGQLAVVMSNFADGAIEVGYDSSPLIECVSMMQGWSTKTNFDQKCTEDDMMNMNILFSAKELFHPSSAEVITPRELILGQRSLWIQAHQSLAFLYEKLDITSVKDGFINIEERRLYRSSIGRLREVLTNTSTIGRIRMFPLDENGRFLLRESEVKFNHVYELLHMAVRVTYEKHEENVKTFSMEHVYEKGKSTRDVSTLVHVIQLLCNKLWLLKEDPLDTNPVIRDLKEFAFTVRETLFLVAKDLDIPSCLVMQWLMMILWEEDTGVSKEVKRVIEAILSDNKLGPIVFVTPELGKWSTVGGLGVMVDELSQGLAQLGCEVWCVSPYYNWNRKGETGYLTADGIEYTRNVTAPLSQGSSCVCGVHVGKLNGVNLVFLHNPEAFPRPYPGGDPGYQTYCLMVIARSTLQYFAEEKLKPSVVVTNDWFTGLVAPYARGAWFGNPSFYIDTSFLHIAHNLDPSYEGRIYPRMGQGDLGWLHELPSHILKDPYWSGSVLNPSRSAILMSDQWATVSRSYRDDLQNLSPLAPLLNRHVKPFGYPNGILIPSRQAKLRNLSYQNHMEAKSALQIKYFHSDAPDPMIPLYAFVGRITEQKGVHLIANAAEQLIHENGGRIQILVGGMANESDAYSHSVADKLRYLSYKYPSNFWADPGQFFTDGPIVNLGADFGLMPSLFEPGGIVQHEFFVAGTPVIVFKTGGLKDTVTEFNMTTGTGSGFVFETYCHQDYVDAVHRSLRVFYEKESYDVLRVRAAAACIDLSEVSWAWNREFHRLRRSMLGLTPVVLRYSYKGEKPKSVLLSGDFTKWADEIELTPSAIVGQFEITLYLEPGEYQYKFKVDDDWTVSEGYPVMKGPTGQINNYINVETY